jgi:hypothetical protein
VSVLLRQPHGFEGLGVVPEVLNEEQFALGQGDSAEARAQLPSSGFDYRFPAWPAYCATRSAASCHS